MARMGPDGLHIDLASPLSTPVSAAANGTVIYGGLQVPGEPAQGLGMYVRIRHTDILATLYARLDYPRSRDVVRVGDQVIRGQLIGYTGVSGLASCPIISLYCRRMAAPSIHGATSDRQIRPGRWPTALQRQVSRW
ncbi:MAG: M23 family metallopeptidase [Chloroflexi bacterium]|nr:M23 family metallopeptidase [Chloroflexota bacterium]